ncbi:DGQHR domain-containing protein [Paenibacillus xylanilyticus]|uniref:DGQHR domain-containing protein n=1 Tax=Paenibacillus xylanilyticus TaxID=248903 RepID=A0A7Y6EU91_9BACL|nr:DGQHR domain-containing protein [Paenibacillus xylanilyticus]NUU75386.1 DGQHR domain-containing protein [Paenibacillus xylanilyticus]
MRQLPHQIVIENVVQTKMRGKIAYQSAFPSSIAVDLTYVKPYNDPSGKGYQRPVDQKRVDEFALYLSKGDNALFTPILLNASGMWEFTAYDSSRPMFGRLFCKNKASLMDGQHRLGGIKRYTKETQSEINVPFMVFHYLDDDEEIQFFDIINTKAKGLGTSLSKFLKRENDELSWMSTELLILNDSPFYHIGSITGKRSKGRHITLQNLYRMLKYFFKDTGVTNLSKHEKVDIVLVFFNIMRQEYPHEWLNYKEYKLTHIVCLDALAMAASKMLFHCKKENSTQIDHQEFIKSVKRLKKIDWSIYGPFKYLKGISSSKTLAIELFDIMNLEK